MLTSAQAEQAGFCMWGFHHEQDTPWPIACVEVEYPLDDIRLRACHTCAKYMEYFAAAVIKPRAVATA